MSDFNRRTFLGSTLALAGTAAVSAGAETASDIATIGKTPHTRFAVNVEMWWSKLPFLDRIRMAAKYGFPAVEFWPWRNKDVDATASLCKEFGITISQFTAWGFSPGLNNPRNHDPFVKEAEPSYAIPKLLNCTIMTSVCATDQPTMT